MKNIKRIDFEIGCANSDGNIIEGTERPVCILFNKTVITDEEVTELIRSGEYEYDNRLVVTTPARADCLRSR